jgi:phosphopantothenoylcysteine decarboxylase/phosphopantothenate--cysteine ligase
VAYGRAKLDRKRLDAIVVNDISQPGIGFDAAENEVTMIVAGGDDHRLARSSKELIADGVLDEVEKLLVSSKESDDRATRTDADRASRV